MEPAAGAGKTIAVGVTGGSGAILARRVLELLIGAGCRIHLARSRAGRMVVHDELPSPDGSDGLTGGLRTDALREWGERDFHAPFASGSHPIDGMVIVPCSMTTLGAIAHGISDNLIRRGADVMLKERRPLILVPRETPLSSIHLRNMLEVSQAGALIIPPVLTFYQHPGSDVSAQLDFIASRILDHLAIPNDLFRRWGEI